MLDTSRRQWKPTYLDFGIKWGQINWHNLLRHACTNLWWFWIPIKHCPSDNSEFCLHIRMPFIGTQERKRTTGLYLGLLSMLFRGYVCIIDIRIFSSIIHLSKSDDFLFDSCFSTLFKFTEASMSVRIRRIVRFMITPRANNEHHLARWITRTSSLMYDSARSVFHMFRTVSAIIQGDGTERSCTFVRINE